MDIEQNFIEEVKKGDAARVRQMLREHPELAHAADANGATVSLLAAYYGHRGVAEEILAVRPDADIFESCALGLRERAEELLDADISLRDTFSPDGFMPLGLAAFFGHGDLVELLLSRGADPNTTARNAMRIRPIHAAAAHRNQGAATPIVAMLLEHGAEVNVGQHGGWTPLHQAAAHGYLELAGTLLAHGAEKDARNDDGLTPHAMALKEGHKEMAELLEGYGGRQ